MQQFTIEVQPRSGIGSSESRRLRASGNIPSVVYSRGGDAIPASVSQQIFLQLGKLARSSQLFTLKSSDKRIDGKPALVKEVQKDHLNNVVLHVDFQTIREDEEITVRVPLHFVGEAPGVKSEGGILTVVSHEFSVRCLPKRIPAEISVDVSTLALGDSIHAREVPLPEGVKLQGNPDETIVSVVTVRAVAEDEAATAATAATAEGAAAAPAAGAAAPAAGAAPAAEAASAKEKK